MWIKKDFETTVQTKKARSISHPRSPGASTSTPEVAILKHDMQTAKKEAQRASEDAEDLLYHRTNLFGSPF